MKLFRYAISLIACAGFLLCGNGCIYNFGEKIRAHGIYYEGGILREVKDDVIYCYARCYVGGTTELYFAFVPKQKYRMIPEAVSTVSGFCNGDVLIWDPDSECEGEYVCVQLRETIAKFLLGEDVEWDSWEKEEIKAWGESYPQTERDLITLDEVFLPRRKEPFLSGKNVTQKKVLPERMRALKNMSGGHGVPIAWDKYCKESIWNVHCAPLFEFEASLTDSAKSAEKTMMYPLLYAVSVPFSVFVDFPLSVIGMTPLVPFLFVNPHR